MTPAELNSLSDQFLPIASRELAPLIGQMNFHRGKLDLPRLRVEGSVEFLYENENVIMCELQLEISGPMGKPKPSLSFADVRGIMEALEEFCTYEGKRARALIDGVPWFIGDGDDSTAVGFRNGRFTIWVRQFKAG